MGINAYFEKIKQSNPLSFLSQFICPQLVGTEWDLIRQCSLLLSVSRNTVENHNRMGLAILLTGGPGTGKTEFLNFWRTHFDGVMINAEYASKCGLTADARGNEITPGLLAQSNGHIVCIDELDKMAWRDQDGLLQAMEEGRYTVVKGKNVAHFNAEIRAIAACNIIQRIEKPLLDRFDFVFRVHQQGRQQRADQCKTIIEGFLGGENFEQTRIVQLYLRSIHDNTVDYAPGQIDNITATMREYIRKTHTNIDAVSYRNLELSFLRIAYAMAKIEGKNITVEHMKKAIWLKDAMLLNYVGRVGDQ